MSGVVMNFPNTWEEYEEYYGFNDTEQIYTNGSRLIQSLRVKQWLEHIEVSEDAISREWILSQGKYYYNGKGEQEYAISIGTIKSAPSVIPQTDGYMTEEQAEDYRKMLDNAERNVYGNIANTPQVKEGEWIPCTKEGYPLTELGRREGQKWYGYKCPKCNFIYKGNALTESPFCQNCGAKMKGAE